MNAERKTTLNQQTHGSIPDDAYLLIIGAMKCGTTSLFSYLSVHPQICPASVKEPEFFSNHQRHKKPFRHYHDVWPNFDGSVHRYAMEASTGYTKYPWESGVPEKIRDYGIKPKFIYLMRNPFDRIESHFNFNYGKKGWKFDICDNHLISISNYYLQLERYRRLFSVRDMLLLDFDELSRDPAGVLVRVYRFLGLDPFPPANYGIKNPTLGLPWYVRKTIYRLSPYYPDFLKGLSKNLLVRLAQKRKRRVLSAEERQYIREQLKDDMLRLKAAYGVPVQKWGFTG